MAQRSLSIAFALALAGSTACMGEEDLTAIERATPTEAPEDTALQPVASSARDTVWLTIGSDAEHVVIDAMSRGTLAGRWHGRAGGGPVALVELEREHIPRLTRLMHDNFRRCGGYIAHRSYEHARAALDSDRAIDAITQQTLTYSIDQHDTVQTLLPVLDQANLLQLITHLSTQYTNRYHATPDGAKAARWLRGTWKQYSSARNDVRVELWQHNATNQPSVVLTIEGDRYPDEVVVIGGHLDSTAGGGTGPTTSAPGADDDASGVATLSEVARVLLGEGFHPDRTIKFIAYAAEEVGLVGSGEIADTFAEQGIDVVGVLQLDMTNYKGSVEDIALISDHTNHAQNAFLGDLIDTYLGLTWAYSACGYGCSDHASWTAAGFPASIPFESLNEDYNPTIHSASDTLANSDPTASHAMKFARLALAYAIEMAQGDFTDDWTPPAGTTTARHTDAVGVYQSNNHCPFPVQAGSTFETHLQTTGYADMYVRFGQPPTTTEYDCRPYINRPREQCQLNAPADADDLAYVMVRGYQATYTLDTAYFDSVPPPPATTASFADAVARGEQRHYGGFPVAADTPFSATLTGTGDGDLYVRFGAPPTSTEYDCRPFAGGSSEHCRQIALAGQTQAFVMVHGHDSAAYDLNLSYSP